MTRYLLDTNHASLLLRRISTIADRVARAIDSELLLCRPSVGELWYMIFNSSRVESNQRELETFLRDFRLVEFDAPAAVEFGRIKAEQRRAGRPLPDIDIQIAAVARVNDLTLLTDDAHFASIRDLLTENSLRP